MASFISENLTLTALHPRKKGQHFKKELVFHLPTTLFQGTFSLVFLGVFIHHHALGIQSPPESGFMEPKYYVEEVIGHPLLII